MSFCLLFGGATLLPVGRANSAQSDNTFPAFWTKFKTAVNRSNTETVAQLTKFPIGMLAPTPDIKNRAELRSRFREVFLEQFNAAECFARTEPTRDTESPQMFTVACRYKNGSDAAAYQFERTASGWRFTHLQLSTTCRCR